MKQIVLTQGKVAFVDDADYLAISKYSWWTLTSGATKTVYAARTARTGKKTTTVLMHREILGIKSRAVQVDHRNHNSLDNRRGNLRIATPAENNRNRRGPNKNSKSGIRGVSWDTYTGNWKAQIRFNGRNLNLGRFDNIERAKAVYLAANRRYFGAFAIGE